MFLGLLDVGLDDKIWISIILFSVAILFLWCFVIVLPSRLLFPLLYTRWLVKSKPLVTTWLIVETAVDMISTALLLLPLFIGIMADYLPTVLTSLCMCFLSACSIMHIFRIPYSKFLSHGKQIEDETKTLLETSSNNKETEDESSYSNDLIIYPPPQMDANGCSPCIHVLWHSARTYFYRMYLGLKHKLLIVLVLCIFLVFIISAASMVTCAMCIAVFPFQISTYFSRNIIKSDWFCPWNEFCFIYFTVPKFMNESLIMNYHVHGEPVHHSFVLLDENPFGSSFDPQNTTTWSVTTQVHNSTCFQVDVITEQLRFQCWADLYPLKADATYYTFPVYITKDGQWIFQQDRQKKIRTAPNGTDKPITFASGGDVQWYQSTSGLPLAKYAAQQEPLFFQLGGDIHYENGKAVCFPRVDWYLQMFEKVLVTPSGYSIPLVTCIGNHEAGGFRTGRDNNAFYIRYYPHELGLQNIDPQQRNLFHSHQFGNLLALTALDSFVHTPISQQTPFLRDVLSNYSTNNIPWSLTTYHVGMYPSHPQSDVQDIVDEMKKEWKPVMEQYGVRVALEHHFHSFKMTYNMFNDSIVGDDAMFGITYVGDGMFGSTGSPFAHNQPEFCAFAETSHVLLVHVDASQLLLQAIEFDKGEVFRNLTEPLHKFT